LARVSDGKSPGIFSTHPVTADRIARIKAAAGASAGVTLKERFAANVKK
jgi:predicted Zn-dependent protease